MNRFSLSYSEFLIELGKHPRKYGQLMALGLARNRMEAAISGQMPITDDMPESMENMAVESRMKQSADIGYSNRISQLKKAGIM